MHEHDQNRANNIWQKGLAPIEILIAYITLMIFLGLNRLISYKPKQSQIMIGNKNQTIDLLTH